MTRDQPIRTQSRREDPRPYFNSLDLQGPQG